MQVPETVIGSALGTVLLPTLSELADRGVMDELRHMIRRGAGLTLALTLPVVAVGIPLMGAAVRTVFEGRAFTAEGAGMVAATASIFLLGLPAHALIEIAARSFYARQDARTPLWTAIWTAGAFLVLCFILTPVLGYRGVAVSNILAYSSEAVLLFALLRRRAMI
jgi:putative peptidoglycan lipid II flippase